MNYSCNTMYCSNATTSSTQVILVPNMTVKKLVNGGNYGLVLCCGANATANLPVFIQTELGNIPVLCKAGNTLYSSQLNTRMKYILKYGNLNENYTNGQFVLTANVGPRGTVSSTESI